MSSAHLIYPLQHGYIHNWLVAGPVATPLAELGSLAVNQSEYEILQQCFDTNAGITEPPAERATFTYGEHKLTWQYVVCDDDHCVDLSAIYETPQHLRAWAYAEVHSPAEQSVTCTLTCNTAALWLNDQLVFHQEGASEQRAPSRSFAITLQAGANRFLIRLEAVARVSTPLYLALHLAALLPDSIVQLPTTIKPTNRRQFLEKAFAAAYLDREVYTKHDQITIRWPESFSEVANITLRLQQPSGRIYGEAQVNIHGDLNINLGKGYEVPDGAAMAMLMPQLEEFYLHDMRVQRAIPFWVHKNAYAQQPYGTYEERRQEALMDAARREPSVVAEVAKIALGVWGDVKLENCMTAIEQINRRTPSSSAMLLMLLGALLRYESNPNFPSELKEAIEASALAYNYGLDSSDRADDEIDDCQQILAYACAVLAGQRYPEQTFGTTGLSGSWHHQQGQRRALDWLYQRAYYGFGKWDSSVAFDQYIVALSHLADLATNDELFEMSAVVLDKLLFTLAINSYQGMFGSTHGVSDTLSLKSARLEPTAGVGRLLWGLGIFNHANTGTVALACAQGYELPPIIASIATHQPEEYWSREHHTAYGPAQLRETNQNWEVNKVTHRTPNGMLCSAQDYRPGQFGDQQHIWQATLGPDAVVFVNHPACSSQDDARIPNFWRGNGVLPRVAQSYDSLISIHHLPDDEWLGFTHAYFPTANFSEYLIEGNWAFARYEQGYLALTASNQFTLITSGPSAYRELRAYGRQTIWVCHMGRASRDGSFAQFCRAVQALPCTFNEQGAVVGTLRGDMLSFGWHGPLLVNDQPQPLQGFKHYDTLYCQAELGAAQLDIGIESDMMQLQLG